MVVVSAAVKIADGKPVYATFEDAAEAQARQQRDHGIVTGIIRAGDGWQLRYDISGGNHG